MRILLDGRTIREKPTGVGSVIIHLLKNLVKKNGIEFIVMTRKGIKEIPGLKDVLVHETPLEYQFAGIKRFWFEQRHIPQLIQYYQPHILHLTDSFGVPYVKPQNLKVIITLHDLIPLTPYKELMSPLGSLIYRWSIHHSLQKSDAIVCVSQSTANDLMRFFPLISKNRIQIVPNGITPAIPLDNTTKETIFKKINIIKPYILYLGGFSPRKNTLRLIRAFENINNKNDFKYQLILSGRFSDHPEIKKNIGAMRSYIRAHNLNSDVILLDFLSPEEKNILLKNALFFAYISLYEGFGLPVLEALSFGTPVLTSKDGAMEDIARSYALFTDPTSIQDIEEKMMRLITEISTYTMKARKAIAELIPSYSWDETGKKYYQLYQSQLQ